MSVETLNVFGSNPCVAETNDKTPLQTRLAKGLVGLFETIHSWNERQRSLHQLAQLDDRMLKDIGLSKADVAREQEKSAWVR